MKEYDAAVRDLEETRHRTNSQLQGSDGCLYLNLIFSTRTYTGSDCQFVYHFKNVNKHD